MQSKHKTMTESQQARGERVGGDLGLTRVCDTVVIRVGVRPAPELAFGWPVPPRGEDRGRCG